MVQTRGLSRVAVSPGDYRRSRFQVLAGETTVMMREGDGGAGGVFVVQVTPTDTTVDDPPVTVRASVRRGIGAVRVASAPDELLLAANQQTIVQPGQAASAPTEARRDFVANSQFGTIGASGCDLRGQFAPWVANCTPGQIDGGFGRSRDRAETLDGQEVPALEISRDLSSTDPANTSVRQMLDVGVAEQSSLSLTADIKVLEQNCRAAGNGHRIPDHRADQLLRHGRRLQHAHLGFLHPAARRPPGADQPEPRRSAAGDSGPVGAVRFDLRGLVPQPVRLESIEVYASGQGYRARITNVAIIGGE